LAAESSRAGTSPLPGEADELVGLRSVARRAGVGLCDREQDVPQGERVARLLVESDDVEAEWGESTARRAAPAGARARVSNG
jgi:hypothetical protein